MTNNCILEYTEKHCTSLPLINKKAPVDNLTADQLKQQKA